MTKIDLDNFLREAGLELPTLEEWIAQEWIIPAQATASIELSEVDMARVILIRDLRRDFGVNDEGVGIVLHLVDQLHGLRRTMQNLRSQLGNGDVS